MNIQILTNIFAPTPFLPHPLSQLVVTSLCMAFVMSFRDVTRTLIGGGGGVYSCIHVLPDRFLFKFTDQFEFDLKRNSSGRT